MRCNFARIERFFFFILQIMADWGSGVKDKVFNKEKVDLMDVMDWGRIDYCLLIGFEKCECVNGRDGF